MPEAEAPVVWGDFEVRFDRLLGRGGMGSVYEARQVSLDRRVAVKVLDTERAPTEELVEGFLSKFQHEAQALARLNDPRIVTILQAGRTDGKCWYAMELVDGRTIDQRISDEGALEPREAARIAAEVARALGVAAAQGIVHRDVKPANIFLTPDGRVKLGDFGLARSGGFKPTRFTEMNAVAGTPEYASPEQAANGTCDHRSDQYSLGAVLFEMVTERPPFNGANALDTFFKHAHEPPPMPTRLNPGVPAALEKVILRCLEKDPARRYPDYEELIRDLEATRAVPEVPAPTVPPRPERPTLAIRTAIVAGVVLVGFAVWGATRVLAPEPSLPPPKAPPVFRAPVPLVPPPAPPPPLPSPGVVKEAPDVAVRALMAEGRPIEALSRMRRERLTVEGVEKAALDAAWDACDRGDETALEAYVREMPDPTLQDELAGIRNPFDHPKSKAFTRAIEKLRSGCGHVSAPLGEIKQWIAHPDSTRGTWESTAGGVRLRDPAGETWLSRELDVARGFTVVFRFVPGGGASWAGVALSPMSEKSFRMLHALQTGQGRIASLVERSGDRVEGIGERAMAATESHEFTVVERDAKFACFVDGVFVGWAAGPGAGRRFSIGVNRGEIEVTDLRLAR
jgi:hypothetical protein